MAVDNVGALHGKPEFLQQAVAEFFLQAQLVVGVHHFLICGFILHEIMFKGSHLILAEYRGFCPAPQIPHHIHGLLLTGRPLRHEIGILNLLVKEVHQRLPAIGYPVHGDGIERTVLFHGNTAMVKEVGIITFINGPMGVQESYMLMQQFPMLEGGLQGAQQLLLTTAQLQRILWVHGREIHVQHGKCFSFNDHCTLLKVHAGQKDPVVHLILRMALNHGALHFKLNHRNGLVHLGRQAGVHCIVNVLVQNFGHEPCAGVVLVHLGCKHGKGP